MTHEWIVRNPKLKCGKPVIRGTRIKVEVILRWLDQGVTVEELLREHPGLTKEDVLAAQALAANYRADERIVLAAEQRACGC